MFAVTAIRRLGTGSIVRCADNSGLVKTKIMAVRTRQNQAKPGDRCSGVYRQSLPGFAVAPGMKFRHVIVRAQKPRKRFDGISLKFSEPAVVTLSKGKPMGAKVKGPVSYSTGHALRTLSRAVF